MKTKLLIAALLIFTPIHAAEDGGLTGEQNPATPSAQQAAAIEVRDLVREHGQASAAVLERAVNAIAGRQLGQYTANATAFWQRIGTKGKRTLKWLTDLRDAADAAAPSGTDYTSAATRAMLAKWSANPDNTVTVAP